MSAIASVVAASRVAAHLVLEFPDTTDSDRISLERSGSTDRRDLEVTLCWVAEVLLHTRAATVLTQPLQPHRPPTSGTFAPFPRKLR